MRKYTISMVIFNSYVKLPEGNYQQQKLNEIRRRHQVSLTEDDIVLQFSVAMTQRHWLTEKIWEEILHQLIGGLSHYL